uniref:YifB family Mg chelatase-like AAA ATPase n=1 Tax=Tessaracoccus caeni TaxID=3031239 RepID=UPI003872D725
MEGALIEVEAAASGQGTPRTVLVGLPDAALNEAKERVRAGLASAGYRWPDSALTINLSPAHLPKNGTHYDVPIAAAVLGVVGAVGALTHPGTVMLGELGLAGHVRPVRGILPALLAASKAGFERAIVPAEQAAEAELVGGMTVWGVSHVGELVDALNGVPVSAAPQARDQVMPGPSHQPDLADVRGHADAKFALEVAAAGRHHLFLHGAPGIGKTMLASRLPSILPELDLEEAVEVSALHSLAGVPLDGLITRPPYSDPHHTSTLISLIGGGAREIRPGAISLAHRGVLFLDEAPEFGARSLESLRVPLESGMVTIGRAMHQVRFPASFQLILAANPCPCGHSGVAGKECRCQPLSVLRYQERISGPILDRIDIRHQLSAQTRLLGAADEESEETSAVVLARVTEARARQRKRLAESPWRTNGEVSGAYLRKHLPLPTDLRPLNSALARGLISARGVDKVLRIAWTLADLAGHDRIGPVEVRAAMQLRLGEQAVAA